MMVGGRVVVLLVVAIVMVVVVVVCNSSILVWWCSLKTNAREICLFCLPSSVQRTTVAPWASCWCTT